MEIVSAPNKGAELRAAGTSVSHARESRAARVIVAVAAVEACVDIETMVEVGAVNTTLSSIDTNVARLEVGPGMRVSSQYAKCEIVEEAVVDAQGDSTGSEIVTVRIRVAFDINKVTEPGYPNPPTVSRCGLKNRLNDAFRRLPSKPPFSSNFGLAPGSIVTFESNPFDPFRTSSSRSSRFSF
jgi:hypothetical protein